MSQEILEIWLLLTEMFHLFFLRTLFVLDVLMYWFFFYLLLSITDFVTFGIRRKKHPPGVYVCLLVLQSNMWPRLLYWCVFMVFKLLDLFKTEKLIEPKRRRGFKATFSFQCVNLNGQIWRIYCFCWVLVLNCWLKRELVYTLATSCRNLVSLWKRRKSFSLTHLCFRYLKTNAVVTLQGNVLPYNNRKWLI